LHQTVQLRSRIAPRKMRNNLCAPAEAECEINWVIAMKIADAKTILLSMPFEAGGTPPWSFGALEKFTLSV
jgi:hypothetical protein